MKLTTKKITTPIFFLFPLIIIVRVLLLFNRISEEQPLHKEICLLGVIKGIIFFLLLNIYGASKGWSKNPKTDEDVY